MRLPAFIWLAFLPVNFLLSQTVEIEKPAVMEIIQGRLSVEFVDSVSENEARALIKRLGYGIEETKFEDFAVSIATDDSLSPDEIAELKRNPGVVRIWSRHERMWDIIPESFPGIDTLRERWASGGISIHDPGFTSSSPPIYSFSVLFRYTVSEADAVRMVKDIKNVAIRDVWKRPNELIIFVPENEDEQAVSRLEKDPIVAHVSYLVRN